MKWRAARNPLPVFGFPLWETDAIKSGFDNLKDGRRYDALYHSALCRAKADWLIGINATRLFSCLYGKKTLKRGDVCRTPTLKMLVDRDAAIMNFKKGKILPCAPYAPRRRSGKREDLRR